MSLANLIQNLIFTHWGLWFQAAGHQLPELAASTRSRRVGQGQKSRSQPEAPTFLGDAQACEEAPQAGSRHHHPTPLGGGDGRVRHGIIIGLLVSDNMEQRPRRLASDGRTGGGPAGNIFIYKFITVKSEYLVSVMMTEEEEEVKPTLKELECLRRFRGEHESSCMIADARFNQTM